MALLLQLDLDYSSSIVYLGIIFLFGIVTGRIAEFFNIPAITGYFFAGILLGQVTGIIGIEQVGAYDVLIYITMGFICFEVGNYLRFEDFKKISKKHIFIAIFQSVVTTAIVVVTTMFFVDISVALALGGIASVTTSKPLSKILDKRKDKKSEFEQSVEDIARVDNVIGSLIFVALVGASTLLLKGKEFTFINFLEGPILDISISITVGLFFGFIGGFFIKRIEDGEDNSVSLRYLINAIVIVCSGIAFYMNASIVMATLTAGIVVSNIVNRKNYIIESPAIKNFLGPFLIIFYTTSGANLRFNAVIIIGVVLVVVFIVSRILGKFFGSYLGSLIVGAKPETRKYSGLIMSSQSFLAIGFALAAFNVFSKYNMDQAYIIKHITLISVVVLSIAAPLLRWMAFKRVDKYQQKEDKAIKVKESIKRLQNRQTSVKQENNK